MGNVMAVIVCVVLAKCQGCYGWLREQEWDRKKEGLMHLGLMQYQGVKWLRFCISFLGLW